MKIRDRLTALQRTYPYFGPGRYLYAKRSDLRKRGGKILVHMLMWSDDGRVSIHKTQFDKGESRSVQEWADWLYANSSEVLNGSVTAYINRTFGSTWVVEKVIGWHYAEKPAKRPR